MRKIVWMMSVSVDGYMAGPNRQIDWPMVDDEFHRHMIGWLAAAGEREAPEPVLVASDR